MTESIPIYRLMHVDNLPICLERGGLHAPHYAPENGLSYTTIHNVDIQQVRRARYIKCGPGGTVHDYVAFYLGPRPPILLQLHTGKVPGYDQGQEPLIYIVSKVQSVIEAGLDFVFSDGHGIALFTQWFDNIKDFDKVDWNTVYANYWADSTEDMDRQRRKQAEFLVFQSCPWDIVSCIGVLSESMKIKVERILNQQAIATPVQIRNQWYY